MLNLVRNAIDAMDSITDRARVLRVRTERDGREANWGPICNPDMAHRDQTKAKREGAAPRPSPYIKK